MQSPEKAAGAVADVQRGNWVDRHAPDWLKPYARLARWDRPIGFWLLFWPCAFSLAMAALKNPTAGFDVQALVLCFVGAVAMRGAGCTFNDIVDTDIDMKVARTRSRPIPSGQVSKRQAAAFLVLQGLVGLLVLVQFNGFTIVLGIASLLPVAIYPFMKRITWWPQFFLGIAFSWGALLGWSAQAGGLSLAPLLLYAGSILWTIGYDTIYALQDIEDDMLVGVKSSARAMGGQVKAGVALCYAAALGLWGGALCAVRPDPLVLVALVPAAVQLTGQVVTLDVASGEDALAKFRSNRFAGLLVFAAMLVVGTAP